MELIKQLAISKPLSVNDQLILIKIIGEYNICFNPELKHGYVELSSKYYDEFSIIKTGLTSLEVIQWHIKEAQSRGEGIGYKTKALEVKKAFEQIQSLKPQQ